METPIERSAVDVARSRRLRLHMNDNDPSEDPAGWQVSDTGTVWTEIYDSRDPNRRTQVVAITPWLLFLVMPISDVSGLATVEDFHTLAGAQAWWEDRGI